MEQRTEEPEGEVVRETHRGRAARTPSLGVDRQVVPLLVIWGNGVADTLQHKPELDASSQTRIVAGSTATDWLERMSKAADRFTVDWPATRAMRTLVEEADKQRPAGG